MIPDVLSRLSKRTPPATPPAPENIFDGAYYTEPIVEDEPIPTFHITLVEMADDFKTRLKQVYQNNKQWKRIFDFVRPPGENGEDHLPTPEGLRFQYRDGLIYYTNEFDGRKRLCIPKALRKKKFEFAHDRQNHGGFHKTYDKITAFIYIRKLSRHFQQYIAYCLDCQLNQIKRHSPYGALKPLETPIIPFHTMNINFIFHLPLSAAGFNCAMSITCKFSKKVLLIPGKNTWDAADWANAFLTATTGHDWGVPKFIVNDRNAKFMSSFWKTLFNKLGTKLLVFTAYHPQTDGQSERTNQTVEIAFRYFLTSNPGADFVNALPYIQSAINNAVNTSTGLMPNEIIYGFRPNDTLKTITDLPPENFSRFRLVYRKQAEKSIAWANAVAKHRYDKQHISVDLPVSSRTFLRLHHGYTIPGVSNKKLSQQRVGPFQITKRIRKLAYELSLPFVMSIHPVISIVRFEPAPDEPDPFGRTDDRDPPPVRAEDDEAPEYEVERLIRKRLVKNRLQYLVKWKRYGNEHNAWYDVNDFGDAGDAVKNFEEFNAHLPVRPRRQKQTAPPMVQEQHVLFNSPLFTRLQRFTTRRRVFAQMKILSDLNEGVEVFFRGGHVVTDSHS